MDDSELQFRSRSFVRNLFSYIEGNIWCMSHMLIEDGSYKFSEKELSQLKGEINWSLQEKVKYVLNKFNKNSDVELCTDKEEWNYFLKAIKIRDNITHPKNEDSIYLTQENIDVADKTRIWFCSVINQLLEKWFN